MTRFSFVNDFNPKEEIKKYKKDRYFEHDRKVAIDKLEDFLNFTRQWRAISKKKLSVYNFYHILNIIDEDVKNIIKFFKIIKETTKKQSKF